MVQQPTFDDEPLPTGTEFSGRKRHGDSDSEGDKPTSPWSIIKEIAVIVVSALVISWLIKSLLVQAFYIPSPSMLNTLQIGDRVLVSRLVPRVRDVQRGDVVVFSDPGNWLEPSVPPDRGPLLNAATRFLTIVGLLPEDAGDHLIKRTIGIPGDEVTCCDAGGRVTVNGVGINELYLPLGVRPSETQFDVTVPEGMMFVLGDNRSDSDDSRYNSNQPYAGFVPIDNVIGTTFARVWPLNRLALVRNPTDVFANVPSNGLEASEQPTPAKTE